MHSYIKITSNCSEHVLIATSPRSGDLDISPNVYTVYNSLPNGQPHCTAGKTEAYGEDAVSPRSSS